MSPFKRASTDSSQESARWKQKFLDALEEHEQREKSLQQRINTLRRGLLGVSLAGDGVDDQLDRQLERLRKLLRKNDQEAGLEALLEQIEASVLRLDNGRQENVAALDQALKLNIEHLRRLDLPREFQRRLQRFARQHGRHALDDTDAVQNSAAVFMVLLRELVAEVLADTADRAAARPRRGLWSRLMGGAPGSGPTTAPDPDTGGRSTEEEPERRFEPEPPSAPGPGPEPLSGSTPEPEPEPEPEPRVARLTPRHATEPGSGNDNESGNEQDVEGELLRGDAAGGGLAEPGFSYIADHVEPLLLRLLANVHVAEKSLALAESVRETIGRGLNWYDFVAVLEDLVTLLSRSRDEQREEFQGFLAQLDDNLARIRSVVLHSEELHSNNRAAGEAMDAAVRHRLDEMGQHVDQSQDLDELKASVRDQLDSIVAALQEYREERGGGQQGLERELHTLVQRIAAMEDESRSLREHLVRQQESALRDQLTGLYNRDAYDRRIREAVDIRRQAENRPRRAEDRDLCLAVCDVDNFKKVNDTFGHLAGDRVLKVLARELEGRMRETDFVARYGGEEFAILLPGTWLEDAGEVLEQLRLVVEKMPFHFRDDNVPVTVSFGVAAWREGDSPDRLFERADRALYRAKELGRNRCEVDRDE